MQGTSMIKTNVMRILAQQKIEFKTFEYPHGDEAVDGITVAQTLGQDPHAVFKTLVGRGKSGAPYVFCIPVAASLDLKRAAKAAGEKSLQMLHVKELLAATGYVRGGCSPIGMKKQLPTIFDESVLMLPQVIVSAGKIGYQVCLAPKDLLRLTNARTACITSDEVAAVHPDPE